MEEEPIVVGLDVGTAKVCSLVARVENGNNLRILGVGIEPTTLVSFLIQRTFRISYRLSHYRIKFVIVC